MSTPLLTQTTRRYTRAFEVESRLQDLLRGAHEGEQSGDEGGDEGERAPGTLLRPVPRGHRALPGPHAGIALNSPSLADLTFTRWLLWRLWLEHTTPSLNGMLRCLARLLKAARQRQPAPTRAGDPDPESLGDLPPDFDPADLASEAGLLDESELLDFSALSDLDLGALTPAEIAKLAQAAQDLDLSAFEEAGKALDLKIGELGVDLSGTLTTYSLLRLIEGMANATVSLSELKGQFARVGVAGTFDYVDPLVQGYLRNQIGARIRGIEETTRTQIAQIIWQLAGGDGNGAFKAQSVDAMARFLSRIRAQLGDELAGMSRQRAFLIASTEMARAQSFGQMAALYALGARMKQWSAAAGACERCLAAASAGAIPLEDWFPGPVMAPPRHPGCRCSVQAVVPDSFDPSKWRPRSTSWWADMLDDTDYQQWPQVGIPGSPPMPGSEDLDTEIAPDDDLGLRSARGGKIRPNPSLDALSAHFLGGMGSVARRWVQTAEAPQAVLTDVRALRLLARRGDPSATRWKRADQEAWEEIRAGARGLARGLLPAR